VEVDAVLLAAIEALSSATKKNEEKAGVSIGDSVSGGETTPLSGGVYIRFAFQ
jgi:hypothetical protein